MQTPIPKLAKKETLWSLGGYKLLVSTLRIAPTIERTVIEVESTTEDNYESS